MRPFTAFHRGGTGEPLVCLHGFMDNWRTWELALPALERRRDVLAPTLPGHAGGPALSGSIDDNSMADAVEAAMDAAGFVTGHIAGNSLGGFVALQLAARGRARSVVALAPAGGWASGDRAPRELLEFQRRMQASVHATAAHADAIAATRAGRRQATDLLTVRYEHIPPELVADVIAAVAACDAAPLIDYALTSDWPLDPARIGCPVRIVWGRADRLLPWPSAAIRFKDELLPQAEWVELDDVGHAPQLDTPLEAAELIRAFA